MCIYYTHIHIHTHITIKHIRSSDDESELLRNENMKRRHLTELHPHNTEKI